VSAKAERFGSPQSARPQDAGRHGGRYPNQYYYGLLKGPTRATVGEWVNASTFASGGSPMAPSLSEPLPALRRTAAFGPITRFRKFLRC
jgi:hypothetical protein